MIRSNFPTYLYTVGFAVCLLLTFSACQQAQAPEQAESEPNKYEAVLTQLHERGQFNGNALIFEKGEIVYQGSFGIGNIDPLTPLKRESVFRLASVSKAFTAMGIMILKEEGKLSFDQDIRDIIPELPYEGVTVRHLLNHVSGLPDYTALLDEHWKVDLAPDDPEKSISGNEDIIQLLVEKKPEIHFEPNEKWEYSNTGYVLLATIISRVSGMPFEDFLKQNIFEPTQMEHTVVYDYVQGYDENMPNRAFGFTKVEGKEDLAYNDHHYMNYAQGDGGIFSTVDDLLKWDRILYTDKLVSEETKAEAFTPAVLANGDTTAYGFGWAIGQSPTGKRVLEHSGGWVGFITKIYREVEDDTCIILLTNNSTQYYQIDKLLVKVMHNQPYELPEI